jgi:hypothetical protein
MWPEQIQSDRPDRAKAGEKPSGAPPT